MKSFKGFLLTEGKFDFDDLPRTVPINGKKRGEVIHQWVLDGTPVKLNKKNSYKEVVLQYIDADIQSEFEKGIRTGNYRFFKKGKTKINLPIWKDAKSDKTYKVSDLEKTTDLGSSGGSGAGTVVTTTTESAQCVYAQARFDNGRKKGLMYTKTDLTNAYRKVSVTASLDKILNLDDGWRYSCMVGANILYRAVKGKKMSFHRGSAWVKSLEKRYKELNKLSGDTFTDVNKWNPADIWLLSENADSYNLLDSISLEGLNASLHLAFKNKDIYGVSLKKLAGATQIDTVNYRPDKKIPSFESKTIGKKSFYQSKDVYLKYTDGEIQFRGFGNKNDSWQGELGGAHAKLGKLGSGSINKVLSTMGLREVSTEESILTEIAEDRDKFITKLYTLANNEGVSETLEQFKEKLNEKKKGKEYFTPFWLKSKYLGLELFAIIKGKEADVTPNFITYASSQSDLSSVHLKLM